MGVDSVLFNKRLRVLIVIFLIFLQFFIIKVNILSYGKENKKYLSLSSLDEIFYLAKKQYVEEVDQRAVLFSSMKALQGILSSDTVKLTALPQGENIDLQMYTYRKNITQILEDYGDKVGHDYIIKTAISGLLEALNDPYTIYFDKDEYERFNSSLKGGNFYGIGILIEIDKDNDNQLTVVETIKNTPAERADIKNRDIIIKIDGISTKGLSIDESVNLLRGSRGSKVELLVKRKNISDPLRFEIVRDKIHISSVESNLIDGKIGYIKLSVFGEETNKELDEALKELEKAGSRGYILDLRNNGGGYVIAALDVCSKFMPSNSVVVYMKSRNEINAYNTYGSTHKSVPLVVLVNESSASASEITAGALQDSKTALLIGTKTFGKGKVQTIYELQRAGGALKLTTAYYMTPHKKDIDKKGLTPDILLEMDSSKIGSEEDIQLQKAKEYLFEKNSGNGR